MTKILCIDDTPDEILSSGKSLKEVINEIYKDTGHEVCFVTKGCDGVKKASNDKEVKLVLLDVEFNGKIEGSEIADKLKEQAPHVKVIVLTRHDARGKKISFGWKPNVVHYVLKKDLANSQTLTRLQNLSKAVIEDYENKNWELEYSSETHTFNLRNKKSNETFGLNIPSMAEEPLKKCMEKPNEPVSWSSDLYTAELNKVHNSVNTNILNGTDWKMWGALSKDQCAKGQLKLVIGSVKLLPTQNNISTIPYVSQNDFERYKEDLEKRLSSIEKQLNDLKSSKKR